MTTHSFESKAETSLLDVDSGIEPGGGESILSASLGISKQLT